ncbi:TetR/AcrR family transcriptional regulator [Shouchella shacheensis]|uniref:TetR/AcrR family transcriptional regulator n=1 Tax=Shouchella shacheensis TaxID=1649580 RepID=UPI0007405543|nr:TetR/AcrR family transcriptional regulator [Shouchella shacheensis]
MKEKILQQALKLFSNEGYFSTPMQKIAQQCGISKASLYKQFESKEDLLIQAFEYSLKQMFHRAMSINLDSSLSKMEQLEQKIVLELEVNKEQRAFIQMIVRSLPKEHNKEVIGLMKRTRSALLNWHRDSLLEAFGEEIGSNVWDLVLVFQGTLREYVTLVVDDKKKLSPPLIAEQIVKMLQTLVEHTKSWPEVLTESAMSDVKEQNHKLHISNEERLQELARRMVQKVEATCSLPQGSNVHKAAYELQEQLEREEPKPYLVEALALYILTHVDIKDEIETVQALLNASP